MKKILLDTFIIIVLVVTGAYVYRTYGTDIKNFIFRDEESTMYVRSVPFSVTVADEKMEQQRGLSGVERLGKYQGMLFVFEDEDYYSMWMKDMYIPLDIIWINDDLKVVHVEENVTPETYPKSFTSDEPARFVLEVNAFVVETEKIQEGDVVVLPPKALPTDLVEILQ